MDDSVKCPQALEGRYGIITGGAGPIGMALGTALAEQGACVTLVDLPERCDSLRSHALPAGIKIFSADLTQREQLEAVVESVEEQAMGLSFLVNNAALTGDASLTGYSCRFEDQTDEAFDLALEVNLAVPFRLARRLAPALRRSNHGSIVNMASIYGLVGPDARIYEGTSLGNPAGYAASKGGLVQLTRYLATVLAPNVRVNCLAPGGIARGQDATFIERYVSRTPLQRMGKEDDLIGPVSWLVGDASAYVTGQVVAIDGGWTSW